MLTFWILFKQWKVNKNKENLDIIIGIDLYFNINKIKSVDEFPMPLYGQRFGETICRHFGSADPTDIDTSVLYFLSKSMIMDINMFQLCPQCRLFSL